MALIATFRNGKVIRFDAYDDRAEALNEVGLGDSGSGATVDGAGPGVDVAGWQCDRVEECFDRAEGLRAAKVVE